MAHQELFLRQPAPAKETKQQRLSRERESQVRERSVALARQTPERSVGEVLPREVVHVVAQMGQLPAETMTTQQCGHTIARSGGYLGRKGDGPAGWKTLWRGCCYVQTLLEGLHLASLLSREPLNL